MTRLGRMLFWLTVYWGACTGDLKSQMAPVYHVVMDTRVQAELGKLADTATIEHVRCLMGIALPDSEVKGDSLLLVDVAVAPAYEKATDATVGASACYFATLVHWHNHIQKVAARELAHIAIPVNEPRDACGLSQPDFIGATTRDAARVQVVQVNSQTFCWWTRDQLKGFRNRMGEVGIPLWLPATESQLRTDWGNAPNEKP